MTHPPVFHRVSARPVLGEQIPCHRFGVFGVAAGAGFNAQQRRQIFDPFLTTKMKGTGLGMAIAKRIIVEAHGGSIAVGPALGGGAETRITLPRDIP
jgi:nitrogen fixation/metabolism regulation signal transduction histidine kinase